MCLKVIVLLLSFSVTAFAHQGRLDNKGGHKVNKPYVYAGKYIYVKKGIKNLEEGTIEFTKGDFHFHVNPRANGYRDGIYLPVRDSAEVYNGEISND